MEPTTKKYLIWGAVGVGALLLLWLVFSSGSSSGGTSLQDVGGVGGIDLGLPFGTAPLSPLTAPAPDMGTTTVNSSSTDTPSLSSGNGAGSGVVQPTTAPVQISNLSFGTLPYAPQGKIILHPATQQV